ncbi:MAG TPA: M23 family metallopeptidase [Baekduia sp.]
MPRTALLLLAVAAFLVVFEEAGVAAGAERWRGPVPGGVVVGSFSYERSAPYQRGRRRGVDIAGVVGAPVLAVCSGRVAYAGRVPGRAGEGVSIRCGRLVATELGLSRLVVRRGARVAAGAPVGLLGRQPLRLGARVAQDRHGYVDPLVLVHDGGGAPIAPPPVVSLRRGGTPRPAAWRGVPSRSRSPEPSGLPWPAVAGLAVLTSATAGGAALRARRHRRRGGALGPAGLPAAQR